MSVHVAGHFANTSSPVGQVIRHCLSALITMATADVARTGGALRGADRAPGIGALGDVDNAGVEIHVGQRRPRSSLARIPVKIRPINGRQRSGARSIRSFIPPWSGNPGRP